MERIYRSILIGILPVYEESIGDCSKILVKDQDNFIIKYKIPTIIKALANYYMIDLKESKKTYSDFLACKDLPPLVFDQNNIFIPIKTRLPKFKNDRAFGYVNLQSIDRLVEKEKNTEIILKNGEKIDCLARKVTVEKHISNGNIVRKCFVKRSMRVYEDTCEYNSLKPSNKEDIDLFFALVSDLKRKYFS